MFRLFLLSFSWLSLSASTQELKTSGEYLTLTVTNSTDRQRQEVVSIDASQLGIDVSKATGWASCGTTEANASTIGSVQHGASSMYVHRRNGNHV